MTSGMKCIIAFTVIVVGGFAFCYSISKTPPEARGPVLSHWADAAGNIGGAYLSNR